MTPSPVSAGGECETWWGCGVRPNAAWSCGKAVWELWRLREEGLPSRTPGGLRVHRDMEVGGPEDEPPSPAAGTLRGSIRA